MQAQGISTWQRLRASGVRVAELAAQLLTEDDVSNATPTNSFNSTNPTFNPILSVQVADRPIVVLTGGGDTGTMGLVAARHLAEHNAWVQVLTLIPPDEHNGHAAEALNALLAADVPLAWADEGWELPPCDLLIDALVGVDTVGVDTVEAGMVVGASDIAAKRRLIELANSSLAPILSVGSPSKVAANQAASILVQASATLALGWPHFYLQNPIVRAASGDLYLADIGILHLLLQNFELASTINLESLFSSGTIISL